MFVNIAKAKASTNAQSNWAFKLDKRAQYSTADAWIVANLGKYMNLVGKLLHRHQNLLLEVARFQGQRHDLLGRLAQASPCQLLRNQGVGFRVQ